MKRLFRYVCVLLAAFTLLSLVTVAGAAGTQVIDASHTSAGYVTVSYTSSARLKVGIQYGSGKTAYRDCPSGTTSFALDQGNGTYTVSVCQNISGTSYRVVASQTMRVTIDSANAQLAGAQAAVEEAQAALDADPENEELIAARDAAQAALDTLNQTIADNQAILDAAAPQETPVPEETPAPEESAG